MKAHTVYRTFDTAEQHKLRVSIVAKGLSHPWNLTFLPGGNMLVTERAGRIRMIKDGKLSDVCIGTSYADDYVYYYHRPATDDMHGYGPVLLAGSEMIRLMKNEKFNIRSSEAGPTMILEKKPE